MEIVGSFVVEKEHTGLTADKQKGYIQLETDTGIKAEVPIEDFSTLFRVGKQKTKTPVLPEVGFGATVEGNVISPQANAGPDLSAPLALVLSCLNFKEGEIITTDDELVVRSEMSELLELPWEKSVKETTVFREVVCSDSDTPDVLSEKHFLILVSHSFLPNLRTLEDGLSKEVDLIFKKMVVETVTKFKVKDLFVLKHATKEAVASLVWSNFSHVHMLMHGSEEGGLYLEKPGINEHKQVDLMSKEEFLAILKKKNVSNIALIFLSFCYSGSGSLASSLSHELVKSGITTHVLAYQGSVGNGTAESFSESIYSQLVYLDNVRTAFKESMTEFRKKTSTYTPMLFVKHMRRTN